MISEGTALTHELLNYALTCPRQIRKGRDIIGITLLYNFERVPAHLKFWYDYRTDRGIQNLLQLNCVKDLPHTFPQTLIPLESSTYARHVGFFQIPDEYVRRAAQGVIVCTRLSYMAEERNGRATL